MKKIVFLILIAFSGFILAENASAKKNTVTNSGSNKKSKKITEHEAVDLGLSVKWATCNVGASSPGQYGNYYAWGEIKTKYTYKESNSTTLGKKMNDIGGTQYDVAHMKWGGRWRMPTYAELEELIHKCNWEMTTVDGHRGFKVTGPNGNSIFLPAAGYCDDGDGFEYSEGAEGNYWSSTPYSDDTDSWCLYFFEGQYVDPSYRCYGRSIRPVLE